MNEANVKALAAFIREWNERPKGEAVFDVAWPGGRKPVEMYPAQFLAGRGVLVPSALTDDDLIAMTTVNWKEIGADFPAWLERIAKGEPRSPQQEER